MTGRHSGFQNMCISAKQCHHRTTVNNRLQFPAPVTSEISQNTIPPFFWQRFTLHVTALCWRCKMRNAMKTVTGISQQFSIGILNTNTIANSVRRVQIAIQRHVNLQNTRPLSRRPLLKETTAKARTQKHMYLHIRRQAPQELLRPIQKRKCSQTGP